MRKALLLIALYPALALCFPLLGIISKAPPVMASSGGSGGGTPSAVTDLEIYQQGGADPNGAPLSNYQSLTWTAATCSGCTVDHYKIYRAVNGGAMSAYATSTTTSYADTAATDSNILDLSHGATAYAYAVSAVSSGGTEGSLTYPSVYMFRGQANQGATDYSYSGVTVDYTDASGSASPGPYDIKVNYPTGTGGFQPVAAPPMSPYDNLELGSFAYFTMDVKFVTSVPSGNALNLGFVSRVPPGDAFPWKQVDLFSYCTPNTTSWTTCKIPLQDVDMGYGTSTGSIAHSCSACGWNPSTQTTGGTGAWDQATLTTTAVDSGSPIDVAGWISGCGIPADTYVIAHGSVSNGVGTFTVEGPNVSSITSLGPCTISYQRTSFYKFFAQWASAPGSTTFLVNNMGFSTN